MIIISMIIICYDCLYLLYYDDIYYDYQIQNISKNYLFII